MSKDSHARTVDNGQRCRWNPFGRYAAVNMSCLVQSLDLTPGSCTRVLNGQCLHRVGLQIRHPHATGPARDRQIYTQYNRSVMLDVASTVGRLTAPPVRRGVQIWRTGRDQVRHLELGFGPGAGETPTRRPKRLSARGALSDRRIETSRSAQYLWRCPSCKKARKPEERRRCTSAATRIASERRRRAGASWRQQ